MFRFYGLVGIATFVLWVYCVIEVVNTPESETRNLPKTMWLLFVLFFPLVGSVAWLVAGRPESRPRRLPSYERAAPEFPEYDRPGRAAAVDPERDEAFLAEVRARAEEQRRKHAEQRRADERAREERRDSGSDPA